MMTSTVWSPQTHRRGRSWPVAEASDASSGDQLLWNGASPEQLAFMRAVFNLQIQRAASVRPFTGDLPGSGLVAIEAESLARPAAASACQALLRAARSQLANEQATHSTQALAVVEIGLSRAYRAASEQLTDWERNFPRYYAETIRIRRALPGGEHGDWAVAIMEWHVAVRQEAPGFGLHNDGRAIDFRTIESGTSFDPADSALTASDWRLTWFAGWLTQHANQFGFTATSIGEPWHWDYQSASGGAAESHDEGTIQANARQALAPVTSPGSPGPPASASQGSPATPPATAPAPSPASQQTANGQQTPDGTPPSADSTGAPPSGPVEADAVHQAVRANEAYAQSLGWADRLDGIASLLGLDHSPGPGELVQAVAQWQSRQGLDIDGIIGPQTWERMQRFLTSVPSLGPQGASAPGDQNSTTPASAPAQPAQEIAWGARVSPAFKAKVISIAHDLGTSPDYLMAAMAFESSETFSPSIPNAEGSGAVGLIQFMPRTAKALGTTSADLQRMSAEQQLDYVRAYFLPHAGQLNTLDDVYMTILWPAAVGQPSDTILFSSPSLAYRLNRSLDANHDGNITKAEAAALVYAKLRKGLQRGFKG